MKKSPVLSSTPPYDADGSAKQCPPLKDTNANSDDSNNNSFYSVFQRGNKRASVKNIRDAFESAAAAASAKNNDHNKVSRQSNGVVTPLRKPSKIPAPQDRLLQSQTYIERLQRNLATRLSTATVEAFRRDYSPVRSVRTDDLKNNNEELGEKRNSGSGEKVLNNDAGVSNRGEEKKLSSAASVQEPENCQSRENSVEQCVPHSDQACRNCVPAEHNRTVENQSGLKVQRSRKGDFERRSEKSLIKEKSQGCKPKEDSVSLESEQNRCKLKRKDVAQNCEAEEGSQNCDLEKNVGQFEPERKIQNCEPEENSRNCEVDEPSQECTLEDCNQICDIEEDDEISETKTDDQTCESELTSSNSELPENVERADPKEACICNCPERGSTGDREPTPSLTEESVHLNPSKNDEVKQPCSVETAVEVCDTKKEEPEEDNQLIIHSAARARKLEFLNGPKVASSPVAGQSEGKQQRVSWTTRLIQKLTEEEENAKKRVVKVVRPKRIVRFPQKKTAKELEKSKWKPVPPPRSSSVPPTPTLTDESGEQKESKSGIKIDGDTKDAYASLISQLVQNNKTKKQSEVKPQSEEKLKEEDTPAIDREDSWLSSTSEDDDQDSVIAAPGVVRPNNPEPSSVQTESPMKKDGEAGTGVSARSNKNTGIRRLLPTGLFSGSHNKNEPSSVTERLLKPTTMPTGHRVYPQQRPIVETAFLSSPTEPEKQRTRRSQSSSPATRHNTRKMQEVSNKDQTDSVSQRSKSVSPSRRSASSKRTIPETSLILEERLNHIRRELWHTQQQQQPRRPASTTPVETGRHRQPQNSLPSSPRSRTSKSNSSDGGRGHYAVVRPPADAYFHSPPSRRRAQQQSMSHPNDQGTVPSVPQQRKTSSSASSTSTIVPEETPHTPSNTSWNPLLQQTISGSPDIRLLQQQYRPQGGPYAVPVRTQHRSPEGLLQPVQNSVYNSPVPSGRLSAPPVPPSHYGQHIDVSSRRRMMSPEPAVSYARRSVPHFSPPLSATIQVPSPSTSSSQSSPRQQDPVNTTSAQTQTTKSFIQQQQQQQQMMDMSPKSSSSAGSTPGHRMSRQEVEALYWETQRLRAGLSDLSRHLARPQYAPVVKPQPVYNTRARSLSPLRQQVLSPPSSRSMSLPRDTYFTRGTPQRNTIGPIRTSSSSQQHSPLRQQNNNTPTIYEDPQEEMNGTVQLRNHDDKQSPNMKPKGSQYPLPIFKRGSLYSSTSTTSVDSNVSQTFPKRVSFGSFPSDYYQSWPTRNGPASQPPTRQSRPDSIDSDVFLPEGYGTYANLPGVVSPPPRSSSQHQQAPNRPLPPVPRGESPGYGVVLRSPHARWQQQSDTESGSEAGEVQRILQQGSQHRHSNGATYFRFPPEEEWGADGKGRGPPGTDQSASSSSVGRDDGVRRGGGRSGRRDEPRRHTLSGDHHHAQAQQGGVLARSMDLEMSSKSQRRKSPLPRGYPPPSSAMLFDDDPGIMSEVETSSTGFRRGGKQRSSLPVVRTPSKTLERPLGLVFLQYRNETKRALLPNEITSIDTVKALFVRSFPKQLTMEYLDSPHVKIYIHDSSKDMFYELEDLRSHLRDIRDRSVLRLFESTDMNGGVLPGAGVGVVAPPMWDQDQSYFSEPEFDSEYQHQHIHKTKASKSGSNVPPQAPYYMTHSYPPGGGPGASATLPRGGPLLRAYSPAVAPPVPAERMKSLPQSGVQAPPKPVRTYQQGLGPYVVKGSATSGGPQVPNRLFSHSFVSAATDTTPTLFSSTADRLHAESGYMSSPERGGPRAYPAAYPPGGPGYEDPYYSQYTSRSGSITPVIDEEARIRVEHMERQLANLTGLVQKALTQTPTAPREYLQVPPASSRDATYRNDKSVSFEKSVSFSDEPPDMNSPKQHSPQHTERTERERHKPAPPPKPVSLSPGQYEGRHVYRDLQLTPEMYNQLRGLQKKAKDLRQEVRNLRRMSQAQAHSVRETIRDTFIKIRAMLLMGGEESWAIAGDAEKIRLNREEDSYKQEMLRLEKDLTELESTVEELRGNVINRKTRVNMSDVENMALILSKSSKTVADLKVRFPGLQEGMKGLLASEMEKVVREEKFLKEEPERLESALRRCKKLTGTLVTLKRLASVQEQRLPPSAGGDARLSPTLGLGGDSDTPITPPAHGKPGAVPARSVMAPTIGGDASSRQRPENALDALLDELQTFARPPSRGSSTHNPPMADIGRKGSIDSHPLPSAPGGTTSLRRLHSYPSSSDGGGNSPPTVALSRLQADAKPPVPERNSELLSHLAGRRVPPPPPPRTSSRSPLASPTSPSLPPRGTVPPSQPQMGIGSSTLLRRGAPGRSSLREPLRGNISVAKQPEGEQAQQQQQQGFNPASNSSSCESINSQEGMQNKSTTTSTTGTTTTSTGNKARQEILEQRHQELLRKQRALQEQYARLQQLQRSGGGGLAVVPPPDLLLKKTGSESNLLAKMGLGHGLSAAAPMSGSLTHLAAVAASGQQQAPLSIAKPLTISVTQPSVTVTATAATSTTSTTTAATTTTSATTTTTNKIYETDIL